ncbi:tetratricopeptide repeat protein [Fluviibacterium sp. DFM31]|uniref:Tetratricopeptide repeat protein n=1 Tax=Meridianimarinicoccus marinus TaxID=3231483 RepID=A0ABV3L4C4_9RHOB
MAQHIGRIWRFGPFTFDTARAELTRDGAAVEIEPQSLRLLDHLIRNRDRVVSRDDLIDALWQGRAVSDWAVSAAVKALRRSLGDTVVPRLYVRTVHSRGFRFVAEVEGELLPDAQAREGPTILVRMFRCPQAEEAYLADGLTEDLITDLSRHPALTVLSYHTSRALGQEAVPANLGVSRVIGGSLRPVGARYRITLTIEDTNDGRQIWAERFDVDRARLLSAQDQICNRLTGVLMPGGAAVDKASHTARPFEAYDHYLQGRYAYYRYDPAGFADALAHFEAAARCDPGYAEAYAQQAYCRTSLFVFARPDGDATLDPAEALARKAIALDAGSALAHARLGWVLGFRDRPDAAIAAFEQALALSPDNAEALVAYGETLNRLGRPAQAQPLLEAAMAGESFCPPSWEFPRGHSLVLLGAQEEAVVRFRAVLARVPGFVPARVQMIRALVELGQTEAASGEVAHLRRLAPRYGLVQAARMFPYPDLQERDRLQTALSDAGMT